MCDQKTQFATPFGHTWSQVNCGNIWEPFGPRSRRFKRYQFIA